MGVLYFENGDVYTKNGSERSNRVSEAQIAYTDLKEKVIEEVIF